MKVYKAYIQGHDNPVVKVERVEATRTANQVRLKERIEAFGFGIVFGSSHVFHETEPAALEAFLKEEKQRCEGLKRKVREADNNIRLIVERIGGRSRLDAAKAGAE